MPSCQFAGGPAPEGTVPAPAETSPALAAALYVVATPIGNLEDISSRAARTLRAAAWIAAEDTRSSRPLLQSLGIGHARCLALHAHNEESQAERVLDRIRGGESVALITDAGTPGISDPGALLVAAAVVMGVSVWWMVKAARAKQDFEARELWRRVARFGAITMVAAGLVTAGTGHMQGQLVA